MESCVRLRVGWAAAGLATTADKTAATSQRGTYLCMWRLMD
jgi:hypothetical protein